MSFLSGGKDFDVRSAGINRKYIHKFAFMLGSSAMLLFFRTLT